ncbi:hypothetical protein LDENG_00244690 [Lucifuga dentata]|nr:hypothetical protein LDENG_00244690 [Lucifuga dentata]
MSNARSSSIKCEKFIQEKCPQIARNLSIKCEKFIHEKNAKCKKIEPRKEIESQNNKFIQRPNISAIINLYIIWNRSLTIMALLVWLHILLVAPTTGSPGNRPLLDQVTQSERY